MLHVSQKGRIQGEEGALAKLPNAARSVDEGVPGSPSKVLDSYRISLSPTHKKIVDKFRDLGHGTRGKALVRIEGAGSGSNFRLP